MLRPFFTRNIFFICVQCLHFIYFRFVTIVWRENGNIQMENKKKIVEIYYRIHRCAIYHMCTESTENCSHIYHRFYMYVACMDWNRILSGFLSSIYYIYTTWMGSYIRNSSTFQHEKHTGEIKVPFSTIKFLNCYLFGYWRGEVVLNMRLSVMVQYVWNR